MSRPVLISLSPNTESDDVALAWRLLWQPWQWRQTTWLDQLKQSLSHHFNRQPVVLTSSGRSALYILLQALHIGTGDEVIVQALTCVAVPAPITWVGATPVYADIQPDTYNLDPASVAQRITPRTKAIIVQHTFGIPGPLTELRALADQHHLVLIEDCAHGSGGTYKGQPLGTVGDVAFTSFGRDKTISSVFGGAVTSRNAELIRSIEQLQDKLPWPPYWWVKQQLNHPLLFSIITRWYFTAGLGKALLVLAQKLHLVSKAVQPQERRGGRPNHVAWRLSPALAQVALHQLAKLPRYTARRRAIAARYHQAFPHFAPAGYQPTLKLRPAQRGEPNWLRFPLQVKQPQEFLRKARQQRLLLGDWYNSPVFPAENLAAVHYQIGSCPVAEKVAAHIINLPTYPLLTDAQVEQIIQFTRPYVTKH